MTEPFDNNPENRYRYWIDKLTQDRQSQGYKKFIDNLKESRHFRENELDEILPKSLVSDPTKYVYKDSGARKIEDWHIGRFLANPFKVLAAADTQTGSLETPQTKGVADTINDQIDNNNTMDILADCGGDNVMDGMAYGQVRPGFAEIDPKLGATKIHIDYCDAGEFILDGKASNIRNIKHIFRLRRMPVNDIRLQYPQAEVKVDKLEHYPPLLQDDEELEAVEDNMTDFLEVEFVNYRRVDQYQISDYLAQVLGLSETLLDEAEMNALSERVNSGAIPDEDIPAIISEVENIQHIPQIVREYYYDCFNGGKSLLPLPKLLPFDSALTTNGFSFEIFGLYPIKRSPYYYGLVHYQKDKMAIRMILLTLYVWESLKRNQSNKYVNVSGLVNATRDVPRLEENKGGVFVVDGSSPIKEIEFTARPFDAPIDHINVAATITNDMEEESGIRKEVSGTAPFAGAPAAGISMMMQASAVQFVARITHFNRHVQELIRKFYVYLREYSGITDIPDGMKIEVKIDPETQQEKDNKGIKALNMYQSGLLDGATTLEMNGFENSPMYQQLRQMEDIGKVVMSDPELSQIVQQKIAMSEQQGQSQQAGQ